MHSNTTYLKNIFFAPISSQYSYFELIKEYIESCIEKYNDNAEINTENLTLPELLSVIHTFGFVYQINPYMTNRADSIMALTGFISSLFKGNYSYFKDVLNAACNFSPVFRLWFASHRHNNKNELSKQLAKIYLAEINEIKSETRQKALSYDGDASVVSLKNIELNLLPLASTLDAYLNNRPVTEKKELKPEDFIEFIDINDVGKNSAKTGTRYSADKNTKRASEPQHVSGIVQACRDFLEEETPESIVEYLNEYIAGQEEAKKVISKVVYEHVARIAYPEANIPFDNYVMFGPTGCGKTEICRRLSKLLPVPIEIIDTSTITEEGFRGNDKEDLMFSLLAQNPNIEKGIIILDEFDKTCLARHTSHGDDVGKNLQSEMLKMIEGTTLWQRNADIVLNSMSTENITFICAGAFDGAFKDEWTSGMGFGSEKENLTKNKTITECLIEYGMIPELAGRIVSAIPIVSLTKENLLEILTKKSDNCIENIKKLFEITYKTEIVFTDEALDAIAENAIQSGLGARGLHGIIAGICHSEKPQDGVLTITDKTVNEYYNDYHHDKEKYNRNSSTERN